MTIDFGFYKPVTIGDLVWNDANANGIQDVNEAGIAGVTLTLTGTTAAGSAVTATTTTDAGGHYLFTEPPGTYTVAVTAPAGYTATVTGKGTPGTDSNPSPSGTTPSALPQGTNDLTIDFGFYKTSKTLVTIGDYVWNDLNGNGVQDDGTTNGLANVGLTLIGTNSAGTVITNHVVTDSTGFYLFTELPGTYLVSVDATNFNSGAPLAGYVATLTGKGTTATDNNTSPSGTTPATLTNGVIDLTLDFGYYKPVTIGDYVWNDLNGDGIQNDGAAGITNVGLVLVGTNATGVWVTNYTTTDANGHYQFAEPPGTYVVSVNPTNFTAGGPLNGFKATVAARVLPRPTVM